MIPECSLAGYWAEAAISASYQASRLGEAEMLYREDFQNGQELGSVRVKGSLQVKTAITF